jgi:hypothetical protein
MIPTPTMERAIPTPRQIPTLSPRIKKARRDAKMGIVEMSRETLVAEENFNP